ncbi:MAG TPA: metallophosphoesterase [Candidatus Saccharimonadales bacterium]|nr:metallophosphoesterase [Candidatus Saccharimonadales bacterium]
MFGNKETESPRSPKTEERSKLSRYSRNIGKVTLLTAVGIGGGSVAMNSGLGQTPMDIGPVATEVGLKVDYDYADIIPGDYDLSVPYPTLDTIDGETKFNGGFLGNITADTHDFGPQISIKPTEFDLDQLTDIITAEGSGMSGGMSITNLETGTDNLRTQVTQDIEQIADDKWLIYARSIGAFAGGAALSTYLASAVARRQRLPSREQLAAAGLSTAMLVGSSAGLAEFDTNELANPTFHGTIAQTQEYTESISKLDDIDRDTAYKNIGGFYAFAKIVQQEAARRADLPPTAQRLLFVSDIHNRDVYAMLENIVKSYEIDAVIDSGDLTDLGTAQEALFATDPDNVKMRDLDTGIEDLGVMYYYASGNHDSPAVAEAVDELKNAVAAGPGEIRDVNINGFRVTLAGDPFHSVSGEYLPGADEVKLKFNQRLRHHLKQAAEAGEPTDLVVTHEPEMLAGTGQYVAMTGNGHLHHPEIKYDEQSDTWNIQTGTTGGSGLRMAQLDKEAEQPMPTPDEQSFTLVELAADCQLIKVRVFNINPFTNKISVSTKLNDHLDTTDSFSQRCAE